MIFDGRAQAAGAVSFPEPPCLPFHRRDSFHGTCATYRFMLQCNLNGPVPYLLHIKKKKD